MLYSNITSYIPQCVSAVALYSGWVPDDGMVRFLNQRGVGEFLRDIIEGCLALACLTGEEDQLITLNAK